MQKVLILVLKFFYFLKSVPFKLNFLHPKIHMQNTESKTIYKSVPIIHTLYEAQSVNASPKSSQVLVLNLELNKFI